eukprot:405085-Lingulodinium_polyedra.AAC.1
MLKRVAVAGVGGRRRSRGRRCVWRGGVSCCSYGALRFFCRRPRPSPMDLYGESVRKASGPIAI